ncbi:hypothetical protein NEIMUCOT_06399 [Neisseria mucosa ATCC 25996]|uniref:Uncharacterized protein n=1 Tax=Neisseria mucosa (strain ATCC 25996 / DSM 4631 / NCTC 10774 / M26) TaxID=546266 RepID=D3A0G3_NEIM2|nr:hypothetical protein NEIMUCOT_06399 [Neisseria mucosa ATCC 25996]
MPQFHLFCTAESCFLYEIVEMSSEKVSGCGVKYARKVLIRYIL